MVMVIDTESALVKAVTTVEEEIQKQREDSSQSVTVMTKS